MLVKNKYKLNNYLLSQGVETRFHHYKNCEKIFNNNKKTSCINSDKFENEIICLPNHGKISLEHINYIVKMIAVFYSKN